MDLNEIVTRKRAELQTLREQPSQAAAAGRLDEAEALRIKAERRATEIAMMTEPVVKMVPLKKPHKPR